MILRGQLTMYLNPVLLLPANAAIRHNEME
jgi:hypothetical protein